MSDVNLQLVREFFELNVFHVLTYWPQEQFRPQTPDHSVLLFVENINPGPDREPGFLLQPPDLSAIRRAMVDVRAWHGDRFYPSVIDASPILLQLAEEESLAIARDVFGDQDFATILVVSELPASADLRQRSIRLLQEAGIGHVIEFPTVLRDLLGKISVNRDYTPSPTLQILRLLKRYRFIRNQQMEFSFPMEPPAAGAAPAIETAEQPGSEENRE